MTDNLSVESKQLVTALFETTTAIVAQAGALAQAGEAAREEALHLWESVAASRENLNIVEATMRHLHDLPDERASDLEALELIGMVGAWADETEKYIRAQIADHGHLHMGKSGVEHFVEGFVGVQEMMKALLNGFTVKVRFEEEDFTLQPEGNA